MPLFQLPDEVLDLPSTDDNDTPPADDDADYSSASSSTKISEAATKLANTGEITNFDSLTRSIELTTDDTSIFATDATTGEMLSEELAILPQPEMGPDNQTMFTGEEDNTIKQRVKLSQLPAVGKYQEVEFINMPTIQENRSVNYEQLSIAHHPGEILKYRNSGAREWTIRAKLTARNRGEAEMNLIDMNTIRSWTMPFYGVGTGSDAEMSKYLGAPPPIITLTAYGERMIGPVPCVLTNYSWSFPNDCDYIPTLSGEPMPAIIDIDITLKESYSPAEYTSFDLSSYKRGNMPQAFSGGGVYSNVKANTSSAAPSMTADEIKNVVDEGIADANNSIKESLAIVQDYEDGARAAAAGAF